MKIIFCSSPINNKLVDPGYEAEFNSALKNGLEIQLIDFEELLNKNINKALKTINECSNIESAIFRGWMLTPETYELLYQGLKNKNIKLINNPVEYTNCHYFPESYEIIKDRTPQSIYLETSDEINFEQIMEQLKVFVGKPIIVKDYVKSQKHKWQEACFIHSANDPEAVKKVVSNFIRMQGPHFNKGLVFREFCQLEFIGDHSKSKMPLTREYRIFFLNGKFLDKFNYWDEGAYPDEMIDMAEFGEIAGQIKSNFFTMDIARQINGEWLIIELGDGQVAGLPDNADTDLFYNKINNNFFRA